MSWVTPLATLNTATWVPGTSAHTWQATAAGGMSIGLKGTVVAAKTLALTVAQLYTSPDVIQAAKGEFDKSRGPASSTSRSSATGRRRWIIARDQLRPGLNKRRTNSKRENKYSGWSAPRVSNFESASSERLVGLLRDKKIRASVHRRAGSPKRLRISRGSSKQKEKSARLR